jgi:hypothetical protein
VGNNFYIQMINDSGGSTVRIHNKDGSVAAGPFALDSLGSGNCASGLGDPVALFDEAANRWMLSEFSSAGNRLCVYISQTADPISGGWFAYDFQAPSFPDYPKYGVWPDAYYVGTNETSSAVYALERSAMLAGGMASFQRLTVPNLSGFGFQMLIPSDLDGATAPPAGSPNYFMRHRDDEVHSGGTTAGQDFLEIWEFTVDFANSANSSITGPTNIGIAEIDSSLCGLTSFACITQPGTATTLDPLREVVMNRLQYRNFGTHEVLVGNLSTDVNGADRAGVRWFELRNTGSGWGLHQEGTYAPAGVSRWMGAISMDGDGNIALGYNASSSSVNPSLRYTGRLAADPLGVMTQAETTLVAGSAANASNRYGDYAAMSVDPADDCTFWFTGQYNPASQWATRIGSFSFDSCGGPVCTPQPIADAGPDQTICLGDSASLGTASLAGHSYSWAPGGQTSAQITVSPSSNTTYTLTASTICGNATDTVAIVIDDGAGGLNEDFEAGLGSWTTSGLWHLANNSACATPGFSSPVNAVYYGQDATCNYDAGTNTGALISPSIAGINGTSALSFDYFRQVESFAGTFDTTAVAVSVAGSGSWTTVWSRSSADISENAWVNSGSIDLSAFAGSDIQIRFLFDTVDGVANAFTGWFIDDVAVGGDSLCTPPTNTPPTVSITAPASGSSFSSGSSVTFSGTATDAEDGSLSSSISWTSTLDGALGSGASVTTSGLSVGNHTITASVTDSGSLSAADSIALTITAVSTPVTVTFTSIGAEDGWVRESNETSNVGGAANSTGAGSRPLRPGDATRDRQYKAIVSFDTSSIPAGATIQSATLALTRGNLIGSNPFTSGFGQCLVDIQTGGFGGSTALAAGDFQAAATATAVASMSSPPANLTLSEGSLNAAGLNAINLNGSTQLRIYFELDDNDDNGNDHIGFYSGDNSNASRHPRLVVTYLP